MSATIHQLNMFGPPEPLEHVPNKQADDAPVPCEREHLWPSDLVELLGAPLLERLYGDLPRRTRLTVREVCRRLRCGNTHVYDLIEVGSLDALDDRHPHAMRPNYTIYRYSLVCFLFNREFGSGTRCNLPDEDLSRGLAAVETLKRKRSKR
jgi:hypothetical protein